MTVLDNKKWWSLNEAFDITMNPSHPVLVRTRARRREAFRKTLNDATAKNTVGSRFIGSVRCFEVDSLLRWALSKGMPIAEQWRPGIGRGEFALLPLQVSGTISQVPPPAPTTIEEAVARIDRLTREVIEARDESDRLRHHLKVALADIDRLRPSAEAYEATQLATELRREDSPDNKAVRLAAEFGRYIDEELARHGSAWDALRNVREYIRDKLRYVDPSVRSRALTVALKARNFLTSTS